MKRSHDYFYIKEDSSAVKDSFVAVADEIVDEFSGSIADVGCATGAFPAYLLRRFPSAQVAGIEYLTELREQASRNFEHIDFISGDVTDKLSVAKTYDVITMLGVLCIFDKYELVLANVLSWLKPNGVLILHNMISEADVDVFVKYSPSSSAFNEEKLESGWNIISEKSLGLVCSANGSKLIKVKRFELSVDLMPKPQDPLRSWTEVDTDGRKQIYNSLHLRQPQKVAVIRKLP